MKKWQGCLLAGLLLGCAAAYGIGAYFVDYALKRGNADDPKAPPAACARIQDKGRAIPPPPKAPSEDWAAESPDGRKLAATLFLPERPGHRWAILIHGYGRDRRYAGDYAEAYLAHGFRALAPDLCASGESEGEYVTMGVKESEEIALWTRQIRKRDPHARIVLHGVSMGAATALLAAAREDAQNVVAVIEDCGYTSAYEMFSEQLGVLFGLPPFPVMGFVDAVSWLKTGSSVSDAAPIQAMPGIRVPVLLIHGDADGLVPVSMMDRLFDACAAEKRRLVIAGAGHGDAMKKGSAAYWDCVFGFLARAE